jgi:hypothetical protein
VFAGKAFTALGFSFVAILALAVSSMTAGVLLIGSDPLIDLSGVLRPPPQALSSAPAIGGK